MSAIIKKIPDTDYFVVDALNATTLKRFAECPAKALVPMEDKPAFALGRLIHCAVLEPGALEARYMPTKVERRGTKAWDAAEQATNGRELVKIPEWEEAMRIRDSVWASPVAAELLKGCRTEVAAFWTDEDTGLDCKAKADGFNQQLRAIVDLKSTEDASPRGFAKSMAAYKMHWQAAFYLIAPFSANNFVFIAVEKKPPYLVGLYELDHAQYRDTFQQVRDAMERYAECKFKNEWPGYSPLIETITLPDWAIGASK